MVNKALVFLGHLRRDDEWFAGKKAAQLGELFSLNIPVSNGFIITNPAYNRFIEENKFVTQIQSIIKKTNFKDQQSLNHASQKLIKLINSGKFSRELTHNISTSYKILDSVFSEAFVDIYFSLSSNDFSDIEKSVYRLKGDANLLMAIKEIWSWLFKPSMIKKFTLNKFKMPSLIVQKTLFPNFSGIIQTIEPAGDRSKIIIYSKLGAGNHKLKNLDEYDCYVLSRSKIKILDKRISKQKTKVINSGTEYKKIQVDEKIGNLQNIEDSLIVKLASIGIELEKHSYFPQNIEWAIEKNKLYIIRLLPLTSVQENISVYKLFNFKSKSVLLKGKSLNNGISTGPVKVVKNISQLENISQGDILVLNSINFEIIKGIKKAGAVVVDDNFYSPELSYYLRDSGIPVLLGTENATKILSDGLIVTVNGAIGEVFKGSNIT